MQKAAVKTGLVLSGGGARGAYAVGVVQAIVEILGQTALDPAPFSIFSGTSVGSINAGFLAANAHLGDLAIGQLRKVWTGLEVNALLQARGKTAGLRQLSTGWFSNSLLDARPLESLVRQHLSFEQLHQNVATGRVHAMMVAAFNIRTAQTTIFSELSACTETRPTRDPSRREHVCQLQVDHILGSSAMPFVFPACRIGDDYYCDGGLRFNTPISSAIWARACSSSLFILL